jgi:Squalene-hopene cyclase C-terminal domain
MNRIVLLLVAALCALPILVASAALPETAAVSRGANFIDSRIRADGSYGADSSGQDMDSILAIRSAGFDPSKDHLPGGKTPADYLNANAAAATTPAAAAKAALAAKALGLDPRAVSGTNLIANINAGLDSSSGKFADDDFSQSLAILGLACTGNSVPLAATVELKSTQVATDGGWGFSGSSDADTTALAIQALIAAGTPKTDAAVTKAISYLKATQLPDGGWGFAPDSNTSSTAFAIQALLAAGESIDIPVYIKAGNSPVSYLLSQQVADGSFAGFDVLFATNQVVPALAGRTFCNAADTPITQLRTQPTATPTPPATATTSRATPSVAPAAPNTGSGTTHSGSNTLAASLAVIGLLVTSATGAAIALRKAHE